ncbi:glycine betaine ABC transporter substrate-binding protein, partial [Pseudomonas viridiflava]|uniref:glycine betaine ABC transporter substrate-binding protein n=1 Tax=Pseudomonas viridiflava TaxID=33069 RepID=UPI0024070D48
LFTAVAVSVMTLGSVAAHAAETSCSTVRMADPGWSDIAATNAITSVVLEGLGYKTKIDTLAVPIAYGGLKDGQLDVFLGNWMPAQQGFYGKFVATGDVTQ